MENEYKDEVLIEKLMNEMYEINTSLPVHPGSWGNKVQNSYQMRTIHVQESRSARTMFSKETKAHRKLPFLFYFIFFLCETMKL